MWKVFFLYVFILLHIHSCSNITRSKKESDIFPPTRENNMAYQWGKISLACTANDTEKFNPCPTITSRMLALTWTAIFDAWGRYDEKAISFYLTVVEKRPVSEHTLKNKEIAISYAAYRSLLEYYFSDSLLLRRKMDEFGLDPDDQSTDPTSPIGIGNLAAKAVIENRLNDGSNQRGTMANSDGTLYSDYTQYTPVNNRTMKWRQLRSILFIATWCPEVDLGNKSI